MKTALWVVAVNNYLPDLCAITFPNLKEFAEKIGAEFKVITDRKFPDFPPSYEKLQIHELGKDYEWNILIDADIIIHPDLPDPRVRTGKNNLGVYYGFDLRVAFPRVDPYMEKYARENGNVYHGIVTNFLVANKNIHDIWSPLEYKFDECKDWCCRPHILDEYSISRNLGKFSIPYKAFVLPSEQNMIFHINAENRNIEKEGGKGEYSKNIKKAKQLLEEWK